jgi:RNA polymerase sigma-70 factor (ECF subfamily)
VSDESEAQLIHAAQRGDREAMNTLLAPWNDRIFGFLLGCLRHHADAEDAAQETFIRIVRGLPKYEHRGQFRAWVFQIARNQAALTAQRRQRTGDREMTIEPPLLEAMPAEADEAPDYAPVRAALERLPETEREVMRLRLDEDLKFHEIAARTGAPLNTVLGRMRNATRRLREILTLP